jgi:hypothetical protein
MSVDRARVVYVAGSGHTGSTLLALLLDSHPEIACVGETAVKPKIRRKGGQARQLCSCGAKVGECAFWTRVFEAVRADGHDFGAESWSNDYRFEHPVAQRLLGRACSSVTGRQLVRWAAGSLPLYRDRIASIDAVNRSFIRAVLDISGAQVFADTSKRVPRLLHLQRLPDLDVKVVLLARDVRGYAASAKRRGEPVLDAARTWHRHQLIFSELAATLPEDRLHRLRYEDLCAHPDETLKALWAFCGVPAIEVPGTIDAADHHVLGNSMRMAGQIRIRLDQSWAQRLDSVETRQILEIAGDINRKLGYA